MIVVGYSGGQPERTMLGSVLPHLSLMRTADLFMELIGTYRKHGWELRCVLMQPDTLTEFHRDEAQLLKNVAVKEDSFDAMWFARPSHNNREAWELRLLAQTQYALFETFEADETEEQRDDMKREMEARLREYAEKK